jgi:aminopeptidase N
MPGVIKVPQVACVTEGDWQAVGGFDVLAGDGVAQQWFGALLNLKSHREDWLSYAVSPFLGLLHIESHRGSSEYFANLQVRQDSLFTQLEMGQDIPLAAGYRVNAYWDENGNFDYYRTILSNKGIWLLHMLRFLMYDPETGSATKFTSFMRELYFTAINRPTSNADVIALAEKYYGGPLDWFFDRWLYGAYLPEFDVEWSAKQRDGQWYIIGGVKTEHVPPSFRMPVIMRVVDAGGQNVFSREVIEGNQSTFQIGPFDAEPKDFIFGEFMSLLGKQHVSHK